MRAQFFGLLGLLGLFGLIGCGSEVDVTGTYKGLFSTLITCASSGGGPRAAGALWSVSRTSAGDGILIVTEGACGTLTATRQSRDFELTPKMCDPIIEGPESFVHTIDRGNVSTNGETLSLLMFGLTERTDPTGTENCASTHSATLERIGP